MHIFLAQRGTERQNRHATPPLQFATMASSLSVTLTEAEAARVHRKFPGRVIVVMARIKEADPPIDRRKFLTPADLPVADFRHVIRKRIPALGPSEGLFLMTNTGVLLSNGTMSELAHAHADAHGVLYLRYGRENAFG